MIKDVLKKLNEQKLKEANSPLEDKWVSILWQVKPLQKKYDGIIYGVELINTSGVTRPTSLMYISGIPKKNIDSLLANRILRNPIVIDVGWNDETGKLTIQNITAIPSIEKGIEWSVLDSLKVPMRGSKIVEVEVKKLEDSIKEWDKRMGKYLKDNKDNKDIFEMEGKSSLQVNEDVEKDMQIDDIDNWLSGVESILSEFTGNGFGITDALGTLTGELQDVVDCTPDKIILKNTGEYKTSFISQKFTVFYPRKGEKVEDGKGTLKFTLKLNSEVGATVPDNRDLEREAKKYIKIVYKEGTDFEDQMKDLDEQFFKFFEMVGGYFVKNIVK